ncbi:lantibiotic dehydratase C-terminal domain-containing protein [Corynebacterium marambiense]|uniref:lantibiotic dehydratase C-terminal domain-containing protein n=1 Tax=Corynebacterium marambiense TaxID=2765364 RepID=UPI00396A8B04
MRDDSIPPTQDFDWLSVHLRCDGDTDELLRKIIFDTAEELVSDYTDGKWFYIRYWESGPHLRLRLFLPVFKIEEALTLVQDRASVWLVGHNPGYANGGEHYTLIARALASREGYKRLPKPWQPHGRIWKEEYEPEIAKYGTGVSLYAYERHFCESSALVADALRQKPTTTQKLSLATMLLLSTWTRRRLGPTWQSYDQLVGRWRSSDPLDLRSPPRVSLPLIADLWDRVQEGDNPWTRVWRKSLDHLENTLNTEEISVEQYSSGMDICNHLLFNRLGLTLEQELVVRRSAWSAVAPASPMKSEQIP